jgi:hypothetical protein
MSAEPDNASSRKRLPFEPGQSRKKSGKSPANPQKVETAKDSSPSKKAKGEVKEKDSKAKSVSRAEMAIPDAVSKRMVRRMALFSGIPTTFGMATFVVSYFVVTNAWFKLPNVAVVLVSMGFFGLGVIGLTYGVLSASWDEERLGGWLGWGEFTTNVGRMTEAWRSARQQKSQ